MGPVRLRHIHLPSSPSQGIYPDYKLAAAVQELFRRRLLDLKDNKGSGDGGSMTSSPHPTLISFTPKPTYTLGRRQASSSSSSSQTSTVLSPAEIARLKAPLYVPSSPIHVDEQPTRSSSNNNTPTSNNEHSHVFHPSLLSSPRGGLATYHGPGQVVLWPVMAIKSNSSTSAPLGYKSFTVRCYSRLLENTTIALLQRLFGLKAFTTEDPGVWVRSPASLKSSSSSSSSSSSGLKVGDGEGGDVAGEHGSNTRKISALGIHLRRHVSSLGAAINLDMPTTSASAFTSPSLSLSSSSSVNNQDEQYNPWTRFIACGLEGKGVTCVEEELRLAGGNGIRGVDAEIVARAWAEELAVRMELDPARDVERVGRDEVEEIVEVARREGFVDAMGADEI